MGCRGVQIVYWSLYVCYTRAGDTSRYVDSMETFRLRVLGAGLPGEIGPAETTMIPAAEGAVVCLRVVV